MKQAYLKSRSSRALAVGLLSAAGVTTLGALGGPEAGGIPVPFKPVLEVEQLMEEQGMAFKALKTAIVDNKWNDARKYSWLLAELANVNRQHAKDAKYSDFAAEMIDKSMDLAQSMKGKDAKKASAGLAALNQVCSACHKAYRK